MPTARGIRMIGRRTLKSQPGTVPEPGRTTSSVRHRCVHVWFGARGFGIPSSLASQATKSRTSLYQCAVGSRRSAHTPYLVPLRTLPVCCRIAPGLTLFDQCPDSCTGQCPLWLAASTTVLVRVYRDRRLASPLLVYPLHRPSPLQLASSVSRGAELEVRARNPSSVHSVLLSSLRTLFLRLVSTSPESAGRLGSLALACPCSTPRITDEDEYRPPVSCACDSSDTRGPRPSCAPLCESGVARSRCRHLVHPDFDRRPRARSCACRARYES
ncbi:hypothetical protein C2E23DRAFT_574266 [Lenzites betulinus]|nr:hypothetical protein C2E23DRAFT_574266 [Lenzites betulinus]